jgi:hypothetical protein
MPYRLIGKGGRRAQGGRSRSAQLGGERLLGERQERAG